MYSKKISLFYEAYVILKYIQITESRNEKCLFFDTHAHLSDIAFSTDLEQIIFQADAFLECATSQRMLCGSFCLRDQYSHIYAAIGIHPFFSNSSGLNQGSVRQWLYQKCQESAKIKAIGEVGLDYRKGKPERNIQYALFF